MIISEEKLNSLLKEDSSMMREIAEVYIAEVEKTKKEFEKYGNGSFNYLSRLIRTNKLHRGVCYFYEYNRNAFSLPGAYVSLQNKNFIKAYINCDSCGDPREGIMNSFWFKVPECSESIEEIFYLLNRRVEILMTWLEKIY